MTTPAEEAASNGTLPDILFNGVSAGVFPLLADPATLQKFIDGFLNSKDPHRTNYFRAYPSYVDLTILYYPDMQYAGSRNSSSQIEMLLNIPLIWFLKDEEGPFMFRNNPYRYRLQQKTLAITPFIFVDNEMSVISGREYFGWPKTIASFSPGASNWITQPPRDQQFFTCSAMVRSKPDAGGVSKPEFNKILDIHKGRTLNPIKALLRANLALLKTTKHSAKAMSLLLGDLDRNCSAKDILRNELKVIGGSIGAMTKILMNPSSKDWSTVLAEVLTTTMPNDLGIKEYVDSEHPENQNCYWSLANSEMTMTKLKGFGMDALSSDLSGGYRIHLYQHERRPVYRQLGLSAALDHMQRGENHDIAVLKPTLPFWTQSDLAYRGLKELFIEINSLGEHIVTTGAREDNLPAFVSEYMLNQP
jgi:hypothetical protein